mmetsp:Transcript_254/g.591  ORF Transcript_254/g.591 Transcript_254/m.591 type:complete len:207 (+) Transcript_254:492-1112(+)
MHLRHGPTAPQSSHTLAYARPLPRANHPKLGAWRRVRAGCHISHRPSSLRACTRAPAPPLSSRRPPPYTPSAQQTNNTSTMTTRMTGHLHPHQSRYATTTTTTAAQTRSPPPHTAPSLKPSRRQKPLPAPARTHGRAGTQSGLTQCLPTAAALPPASASEGEGSWSESPPDPMDPVWVCVRSWCACASACRKCSACSAAWQPEPAA